MSELSLRYDEIEPDRRSELQLLDKTTLIEKILELESQVLFDPEVLVDETKDLVEEYETRRRIIDFVEANHPELSRGEKRELVMQHLVFVSAMRP